MTVGSRGQGAGFSLRAGGAAVAIDLNQLAQALASATRLVRGGQAVAPVDPEPVGERAGRRLSSRQR